MSVEWATSHYGPRVVPMIGSSNMGLDFYDIDDLEHRRWRRALGFDAPGRRRRAKKFLMVYFRCCHTYGRLNRDRGGTKYEGRCPRCGAAVSARIGPGGTSQRMFEAG